MELEKGRNLIQKSEKIIYIFFFFLASTAECDLCNKNGKCILEDGNSANVRCECRPWFAGRNCQINLKLLLIVGCVSVILMIVIACGVSCFCCRDRHTAKNSIPCKYKLIHWLTIRNFFWKFSKKNPLDKYFVPKKRHF